MDGRYMVAIDHLQGQMYCQYGMVAGIAVNYDISMLYIYTLYMATGIYTEAASSTTPVF